MQRLRNEFPEVAAEVACGGMRGRCSSAHGLALDELKSAVQKYARRGELQKGMRCLMDAECFALSSAALAQHVRAVRTNVMNRLLVASGEDCLHPGIYRVIEGLLARWEADRDSADAMAAVSSMYATIAAARKGRVASVVKLLVALGADPAVLPPAWVAKWGPVMKPPRGATFCSLLQAGDIRCATLLHTVTDEEAWAAIVEAVQTTSRAAWRTMGCLRRLYTLMADTKKHAEAFVFKYQALVLAVFRERVKHWEGAPPVPDACATAEAALQAFREHLRDRAPIVLDAFCIDMHTARGRAAGMDAVDFAKDGAVVTNADDTGIVPERFVAAFATMYMDSKLMAAAAAAAPGKVTAAAPGRVTAGGKRAGSETGCGGGETNKKRVAIRAATRAESPLIRGRFEAVAGGLPLVRIPPAQAFAPLLPRTCGAKPMTYAVTLGGRRVAIKPARSVDPVVFDACKPLFGLRSMGAQMVRADCRFECSRPSPGAPLEHRVVRPSQDTFLVSDLIVETREGHAEPTPARMVSEVKDQVAGDAELACELFQIGLVRYLFGVTDFNPRNVLIDVQRRRLYSIDENGIGSSSATETGGDGAALFPYWPHLRMVAERSPGALQAAMTRVLTTCDRTGLREDLRAAIVNTGLVPDAADIDRVVGYVFERAKRLRL